MLVSYNWLNEYFNGKLPPVHDVAEKLVTHSFELEGVEKKNDDYVIDIDVLPNRGSDSLSHNGIARELGVIFDLEPQIPFSEEVVVAEALKGLSVFSEVPEGFVKRINKLIISGVTVDESPQWLKERLQTLGQKPINNVVDITNYVMFETGQPIHAFDYEKILGSDKEMKLRFAEEREEVELLGYGKKLLSSESMVWADSKRPLDLAGIKGGEDSGVSKETHNIVLSACSFNAVEIRKTRQRERVFSDASKRFEQGVTAENTLSAIARARDLILEIAGGEAGEVLDLYLEKEERSSASATLDSINSILGINLSTAQVEGILDRYKHAGFDWSKDGDAYTMTAPFERRDINFEHDVIEEVGRMFGYNNIEASLPPTADFQPKVHRRFYSTTIVKNLLVREGWSEVFNYIMESEGEVEIANSMVEGRNYVRKDLTESLRGNLVHNIKHLDLLGLDQIKVFEIGKVFNKGGEHWAVGLAVKNARDYRSVSEVDTIQEAITRINELLEIQSEWKITEVSVPTQDDPTGKGIVAELNLEEATKNIQLPESYEGVLEPAHDVPVYKPFSEYPPILRDIAVWVGEGESRETLEDLIKENSGGLLVNMRLFDEYSKDGRTSYAYHLVFQSHEKTLSDEEINPIMEKISQKLRENPHFEVR